MEQLKKLEKIKEDYTKIRTDNLLTGITLHTMLGDWEIKNPSVLSIVLDTLIHEVHQQIKEELEND